jgi:hypothetical protein
MQARSEKNDLAAYQIPQRRIERLADLDQFDWPPRNIDKQTW